MTGPEHYREAERLLSHTVDSEGDVDSSSDLTASILAAAQVHATLALAAATAMQAPVDDCAAGMTVEDWNAWFKAAGTTTVKGGTR